MQPSNAVSGLSDHRLSRREWLAATAGGLAAFAFTGELHAAEFPEAVSYTHLTLPTNREV